MRYRSFLTSILLWCGIAAVGQQKELVDERIEGHIYKPVAVAPSDALVSSLRLPMGFRITKFAENLNKPRMMRVTRNGTVYVTDKDSGVVYMLRDNNRDGKADEKKIAWRKTQVHGIDISGDTVYLVTDTVVYRGSIARDGTFINVRPIVRHLPDAGQHPNRTIRLGPDNHLYITVGSTCNACDEPNEEAATIIRTDRNGNGRKTWAKGLRNTIGFDWHPATRVPWGFDHGIDWLGDDEQKEELNQLKEGGNYGWPFIYDDGKHYKKVDPKNMTHEEYAAQTIFPHLMYTAHAAPMEMMFYRGTQFPEQYRNSAFVAMHGSWNRKNPVGYNVVRVRFNDNGQPQAIEDFISGFLLDNRSAYFGRPCGLAMANDGSLLLSDDALGVIYRITYQP